VSEPAGTDSPGWLDLMIGVAIIWAFDLVMGVILAIAMLASGAEPTAFGKMPMNPPLLVGTSLLSGFFAGAVSWFFVCRKYRRTFRDGFRLPRIEGRTVGANMALGVILAGVGAVLMANFSTGESFMSELASTPLGLACVVVLAVVVPPFEELYYRGFIFTVLQKHLGSRWSIALVTLWFGVAHSIQLAGDWVGLVTVVTMGFLWTWMRCRFQSLWPSILCHWTYNVVLVALSVGVGE
jgi:hypothetical protein